MATQNAHNAHTPLDALKGAMQNGAKPKLRAIDGGGFQSAMIGAADASAPALTTAANMYGSDLTATTLTAALGGMKALGGSMGGGSTPYMSAGFGGMDYAAQIAGDHGGHSGSMGTTGTGGDTALNSMEMIQMMNQNSLQLMELQAVMQNNMQLWNTRSNILSADHRVRMTMVEKLQGR